MSLDPASLFHYFTALSYFTYESQLEWSFSSFLVSDLQLGFRVALSVCSNDTSPMF